MVGVTTTIPPVLLAHLHIEHGTKHKGEVEEDVHKEKTAYAQKWLVNNPIYVNQILSQSLVNNTCYVNDITSGGVGQTKHL